MFALLTQQPQVRISILPDIFQVICRPYCFEREALTKALMFSSRIFKTGARERERERERIMNAPTLYFDKSLLKCFVSRECKLSMSLLLLFKAQCDLTPPTILPYAKYPGHLNNRLLSMGKQTKLTLKI